MSALLSKLLGTFIQRIADRVSDQIILAVRKKMKFGEIDNQAKSIKEELKTASSPSEKEAILEKVHDLVNSLGV